MFLNIRKTILFTLLLSTILIFPAHASYQKLAEDISYYTDVELCEAASTESVTVKLNAFNMFSIAGYVAANTGLGYQWTGAEIQEVTYNLFGKKPSVSSIPAYHSEKAGWIWKSPDGKGFQYAGGDWGGMGPGYKISKVRKIRKNVYEISIVNLLKDENSSKRIGTSTLRVKKNEKSSYGYIVTALSYKGNGQGY